MFGIRILSTLVAYSVVLLEVYAGAVDGPRWLIIPGALVISLLISLSMLAFSPAAAKDIEKPSFGAAAMQWVLILGASFAMAFFAYFLGLELLPEIYASQEASLSASL